MILMAIYSFFILKVTARPRGNTGQKTDLVQTVNSIGHKGKDVILEQHIIVRLETCST